MDQIKNPVIKEVDKQLWLKWIFDLPEHECVQIADLINDEVNGVDDNGLQGKTDNFILRIKRPDNLPMPPPPKAITPWLKDGWKDCKQEVSLVTITVSDENGDEIIVRLDDDTGKLDIFKKWISERTEWANKQKIIVQVQEAFETIYGLYSRIQRESEQVELMLGDGLLNWTKPNMVVNHPLLLQRVDMEFNTAVPEFTFWESDKGSELYSALLRAIPDVEPSVIADSMASVDIGDVHPLGGTTTTEFLTELAHKLSPRGTFTFDDLPQESEQDIPQIGRSRVLFLRKRNLGFSSAIESILDDLSVTESKNGFIARTIGINMIDNTNEGLEDTIYDPNGEDEEVLLSKEANGEQLQIVKYLNRKGAVLVQGPPGTGKTHTIANIIGHFLSQGKSILVTSHSTKALRVLRDKVVPSLQPLCVSVLSDDNRKELEGAINDITERLSYSNADTLDVEASGLHKKRSGILSNLRRLRNDLKTARLSENEPIVIAGNEYMPIDAAKFVAVNIGQHGWIPGPVTKNEPCPISDYDCNELYKANASLNNDEENRLSIVLPSIDRFMRPDSFEQLIQHKQRLELTDKSYKEEYWRKLPEDVGTLEESYRTFIKAVEQVETKPMWLKTIAAEGINEQQRMPWLNLVQLVTDVQAMALKHKEILLQYDPKLTEDLPHEEIQRVLDEMSQDISDSSSIAKIQLLFKPQWRSLLAKCYVNGQPATSRNHFDALKAAADLNLARKRMLDRWERQVVVIDGPAIDGSNDNPELICLQYVNQCESCLRWHEDLLAPAVERLISCGLNWQSVMDEAGVNENLVDKYVLISKQVLPKIITAQVNRVNYRECLNQLDEMKRLMGRSNEDQMIIAPFIEAVERLDSNSYRSNFQYLCDLHDKFRVYRLRNELLDKIERVAPVWSEAIRSKSGIHGQNKAPGSAIKAWRWRQLNDELDRRAELSIENIQNEIGKSSIDLRTTTAELVEKKAWAKQVRRVGDEQRLALQGWKMTIKKIGKGTGKLVPMLKAEARKLMPKCQTAVPVWIMPLSRVVDNFDPGKNRFDVVIIDEASQSDLMAHIAVYMGDQVIIVGDDEQVSPMGVGQRQDEMQGLIATLLQGIPNGHLYDSTFSIYDLAMTVVQPICLREHFRCAPEIINFSNGLSYDWKIRPLRDTSGSKMKPHTVYYRVDEAVTEGKVNKEEALAITALIAACIKQPEYMGATFGVISLVGEEQALYIDALLRRYLGPAELERRNIQCGNSAHFQGDERDIVFLSMVDTCTEDAPLPLRMEGPYNMFKKRYNVATSRARDQMWVVSSLNSEPGIDLKQGDYRLRLIQHAIDPNAYEKALEKVLTKTESDFEKQVAQMLVQAGYKTVPQWKVGSYRIDLVVEGGDKRLAIECDGDRYHTIDNLQEDMNRQSILERLGWQFARIRGSQFYRDQEKAMSHIFNTLKDLGITPSFDLNHDKDIIPNTDLIERIKRTAAEIRAAWEDGNEDIVFIESPITQKPYRREKPQKTTIPPHRAPKEDEPPNTAVEQKLEHNPVRVRHVPVTRKLNVSEPISDSNPISLEISTELTTGASAESIVQLLKDMGLPYVDKRPKGGALWILGGNEIKPSIEKLGRLGYKFSFAPHGGRATKNKAAWYHK